MTLKKLIKTPIQTTRLIIRPLQHNDTKRFCYFFNENSNHYPRHKFDWNDETIYQPEYMRKLIPFLIKKYAQHHSEHLYIFPKGNPNAIIGELIITSDGPLTVGVHFYLLPKHRRNGYGAESQKAVLKQISSATMNKRRNFSAQAESSNKKSEKILLKNGFKYAGMRPPTKYRSSEKQYVKTYYRGPL